MSQFAQWLYIILQSVDVVPGVLLKVLTGTLVSPLKFQNCEKKKEKKITSFTYSISMKSIPIPILFNYWWFILILD